MKRTEAEQKLRVAEATVDLKHSVQEYVAATTGTPYPWTQATWAAMAELTVDIMYTLDEGISPETQAK